MPGLVSPSTPAGGSCGCRAPAEKAAEKNTESVTLPFGFVHGFVEIRVAESPPISRTLPHAGKIGVQSQKKRPLTGASAQRHYPLGGLKFRLREMQQNVNFHCRHSRRFRYSGFVGSASENYQGVLTISKPARHSRTSTVIPAKAGIQWSKSLITVLILSSYPLWTPAPYQVRGDAGQSHLELQPRHSGESRSPERVIRLVFATKLLTSVSGFPPSRE